MIRFAYAAGKPAPYFEFPVLSINPVSIGIRYRGKPIGHVRVTEDNFVQAYSIADGNWKHEETSLAEAALSICPEPQLAPRKS